LAELSGNTVTLAYPLPTRDSPVKLTPLSILYPGAMWEAQGKTVYYWDERFDDPDQLDDWILRSTDFAHLCLHRLSMRAGGQATEAGQAA